ncbi:universal stress protein [Thiohalomonas denitrificans]|uniref:Nucleotide-binding universal stress protein, UspA family n=1 Tax=Thiohalomonas denitrificans TaxID=415747 RepID=A0A1G5PZB5_9GAMM|nr:universal stress protein [Thiohalomonas denitrificans]SCZ54511.1 Nucleotide-binding universal stress protein, UspA family [Thiohalomonas denitrificans]
MFEHALVAIDFSPASEVLQRRLEHLAAWGTRRLTLVYVLSTRYPAAPAETHRSHYEARLAEMAEALSAKGFAVEWDVRSGEPGAELVAAAEQFGADLILAGSRGHSVFRELFLGSVVLDVARLTNHPLWLEPLNETESTPPPETLLLATDGSAGAQGAERVFAELATRCRRAMAVQVAACNEETGLAIETADAERHLRSLAGGAGPIETRLICGDPPTAIAQTAREIAAGLILVGKRGHNPMRELLLGSTAEAVCRRAGRAVLLVPST